PRPSARLCRHRRQCQRLHPARARPPAGQGLPPGPGATAHPPGPSPGRQGLQLPEDTQLPAKTRYSATIPERADQRANRRRRRSNGGRPPAFDTERYKQRNVVERCFNALKQYRAIATRYDKTRESYEAALTIASLLMWI
ncbi:transposase, partial [Streptomyces sp. For3]|nr:transposase [Streptomyces silvae]